MTHETTTKTYNFVRFRLNNFRSMNETKQSLNISERSLNKVRRRYSQ